MKKLINKLFIALLGATLLISTAQAAQSKGKILIVLSSATTLPLKDGKTFQTGYYLNELIVPAQKFTEAGYELVFANPEGNTPAVDESSVNAMYFGDSDEALKAAQAFQRQLAGLTHPLKLRDVAKGNLSQYKAVFVPGGPAPMIDLMADRDLGRVLGYFHKHQRTTVLLCHGPVALLSSVSDPVAYQQALRDGDAGKAQKLSSNWPYKNYRMTVFSNDEEAQAAKNVFNGEPQFLPQQALTIAGGAVQTAAIWHPNVVQDHELITGQNPFSDAVMMETVLKTLAKLE